MIKAALRGFVRCAGKCVARTYWDSEPLPCQSVPNCQHCEGSGKAASLDAAVPIKMRERRNCLIAKEGKQKRRKFTEDNL